MIALILLKLFLFFSILFIFGWQLSRFILNEKRIEALIPIAAMVGFSIYLFSLNFLSYFIKIQVNFYLLCVIFIFFSYFLFRLNRRKGKIEWGIGKLWRRILFATCFLIMFTVGIIGVRGVSLDEMAPTHLLLDVTIAEGNFPARDVSAPNFPSRQHYGFNLFSAAISKITNMPVWFSYDFLHFIFIGIVFLLGFLLIKDFCKDNFKAYFASLLMIFGGNLNFLYAIKGLSSLYQKYILNLPIEAPFKFLSDMIFGKEVLGRFVIGYSQIAWITLGFALTITVIYLYFRAINDENNWLKISLLNGIIFSFLALSAEIFFGVLCIVLFIYPFIFAILKKDWQSGKFYLRVSFLILFLGLIIASFQGGVVTQTIKQTFFGSSPFLIEYPLSIAPEYLLKGLMPEDDENGFLPIFSSTFFLRWGWLLIFIVPATIYFLKKYFQLGLFLILLIFISFFLPLIMTVSGCQYVVIRINYLTTLFWNLLFGLFLGWLLLFFKNKWPRLLIILLILSVTLQGILYSVLFPFFPDLKRDQSSLKELEVNAVELEAFNWVKKHTTIKDYFLTFAEESVATYHNAKFVIYTRRLAPGFYYGMDVQYPNQYRGLTLMPEMVWYKKILKECDPNALKALNYRYLYVNEYWPKGLEEECLAKNDLELKFNYSQHQHFARIYLIH